MAAAAAAPAITPAEGLPLSVTSIDGELLKVDVGAHVEHRVGEVAALSDVVFLVTDDGEPVERGASENATVCLVTVTTGLFGILCVTLESAFLAGEGEGVGEGAGAGAGEVDEDEDGYKDADEDEEVEEDEDVEEDVEEDEDIDEDEGVEEDEEAEEASGNSIVLIRVNAVELVVESVSGSSGMPASGPS
ncbi:hypothetical protein E4U52_008026 [Claviceps spartinae]|nr:hypothetical protein E4U52_008026 [Claviceps spartinae]